MIEKEIEAILAWQDVGDDGDIDVDGVMKAFERLTSIATEADLPARVAAIQSPKNNFWTRELLLSQSAAWEGLTTLNRYWKPPNSG